MTRERSNAIVAPYSPMVRVNDDLYNVLQAQQIAGMDRAVSLLAGLDYDWQDLAFSALKAGGKIGLAAQSAYGGPQSQTPMTAVGRFAGADAAANADTAGSAIMALLEKCFEQARKKIADNVWLQRLAEILQMSVSAVLTWAKQVVLNSDLIKQLIPGYSAISGLISSAIQAVGTYQHHSVLNNLRAAGTTIGSGIPTVAMAGFQRFVSGERLRAGVHCAYTFAKSLVSVLLAVFAAPAQTIFGLVTGIVEAIESFVYSAFQARTFHNATEKARDLVQQKELPGAEEFQVITAASPFAGCVFFAGSSRIGGFQLTSLLTDGNRVISSNALSTALTQVDVTRKAACGYVNDASFRIKYHSSANEESMGNILNVIQGYADDAPRNEILTDNASTFDRFKHHGRRFGRTAGKLLKKVFS